MSAAYDILDEIGDVPCVFGLTRDEVRQIRAAHRAGQSWKSLARAWSWSAGSLRETYELAQGTLCALEQRVSASPLGLVKAGCVCVVADEDSPLVDAQVTVHMVDEVGRRVFGAVGMEKVGKIFRLDDLLLDLSVRSSQLAAIDWLGDRWLQHRRLCVGAIWYPSGGRDWHLGGFGWGVNVHCDASRRGDVFVPGLLAVPALAAPFQADAGEPANVQALAMFVDHTTRRPDPNRPWASKADLEAEEQPAVPSPGDGEHERTDWYASCSADLDQIPPAMQRGA